MKAGITEHIQLRVNGLDHLFDQQYVGEWQAHFSEEAVNAYFLHFAQPSTDNDAHFRMLARLRVMSATPHEVLCMESLSDKIHAGYQSINNEWVRCYDWEIEKICLLDVQDSPLMQSLTTTTDEQLRVLQHKLFHVQNDVPAPPFETTAHAAVKLHGDVINKRIYACVECSTIQTKVTEDMMASADRAIKTVFAQEHIKWDWEEKFLRGTIYDIVRVAPLYEQFISNVKQAKSLRMYLESGRRFRLAILTSGKGPVKLVTVKVLVRVLTSSVAYQMTGADANYTHGAYTASFEEHETYSDILVALKDSLDFLAGDFVDNFDDLELGKRPGCACGSRTLYHTLTCSKSQFSRFVPNDPAPKDPPPPLTVRGGFYSRSKGLPPLARFQDEKGRCCSTTLMAYDHREPTHNVDTVHGLVPRLNERETYTFVYRVYHAPDIRHGLVDSNHILFSQSIAQVNGEIVKLINGPRPGSGSSRYEAKAITESNYSLSDLLQKLRALVRDVLPPRMVIVALLHVISLGISDEHSTERWDQHIQMFIDIVGNDTWLSWLEQVSTACVPMYEQLVEGVVSPVGHIRETLYKSDTLPEIFMSSAKNILSDLKGVNLEDRVVHLKDIVFLHPVEHRDTYARAAADGFLPAMLAVGTANSIQTGFGLASFEAAAAAGNVVASKLAAEELNRKVKTIDPSTTFVEGDARSQWPVLLHAWLIRSADAGDAYAQFCIGSYLQQNSNQAEGIDYWARAAVQGYGPAKDGLTMFRPPAAFLVRASDVRQFAINRGAMFAKSNPKSPETAIALTVRAVRSTYPEACATDDEAFHYVVSSLDIQGATDHEKSFAETLRLHVLQIAHDPSENSLFSSNGHSPRTITLEGATMDVVSDFIERIGGVELISGAANYSSTQFERKVVLTLKDHNMNLLPRPYRSELFNRSSIPNVVYDYTCNQCGNPKADLECTGCFLVHYCCDGCKNLHWKQEHSKICETMLRDGWTVWNVAPNQIVTDAGVVTEMYDPFETEQTASNFYVRVNWQPRSMRSSRAIPRSRYADELADSQRDDTNIATTAVKWKRPKHQTFNIENTARKRGLKDYEPTIEESSLDKAFEYSYNDIDIPSSQEIVKIKLPPGIFGIGANVFAKLMRLKMVTLDGTEITFIGDNAFAGSANLGLFVGCDALITVGESAFRDCGQLKTASISSVSTIATNAFRNCWKLVDLEGLFNQTHPGITKHGIHPWRSIARCHTISGDVKIGDLLELVEYNSYKEMYAVFNHESKWAWSTPGTIRWISGTNLTILDASVSRDFDHYLNAANVERPTACVVLGMLADETNVDLSGSEIARLATKRNPVWWYAKAAKASHSIGVQHLAREFHNNGDSRELMWIVRGVELNDAVCAHTLGMYYSTGWTSDYGSKALMKLKYLPPVEAGEIPCHVYLSNDVTVSSGTANKFPGMRTPIAVFKIPSKGEWLGRLISSVLEDLATYDILIPTGKENWQCVDPEERDEIFIDPTRLEETTGLRSFPVWVNFQLPCSLKSVGQGCSFGTHDPTAKSLLDKDLEKAKRFLLQSAETGYEPALLDYTKLFGPPVVSNGFPLLKSIGQKAFAHCEQLVSLDLSESESLHILPHSAFAFCSALQHFAFPPHLHEIGPNCFNNSAIRSFVVNAELYTIGKDAFRQSRLQTIDFSNADNLTQIHKRAFDKCSQLTKVTFNTRATDRPLMTLHKAVFRACTSLITTELPMNVFELPAEVFADCISLTTIELGATTKIKKHAFRGCNMLRTVKHYDTLERVDDDAFHGVNPRPDLHYVHT
jgi:hypothetical protein